MDASVIECRRCGRRVSAEAPCCPECRADPRDGRSSFNDPDRDCVRVCEGVGVRFLALALDTAILSGAFLLVALAVFLLLVGGARFAVVGEEPAPWPLWLVFSLVAFVYFWVCEAAWGQTLGKRLFGLRVARTDGGRLGYGGAFARTALRVVDFLPVAYAVGAVAISATRQKQRLGDVVAGTVVVRPRTVRVSDRAVSGVATVPWPGPGIATPGD